MADADDVGGSAEAASAACKACLGQHRPHTCGRGYGGGSGGRRPRVTGSTPKTPEGLPLPMRAAPETPLRRLALSTDAPRPQLAPRTDYAVVDAASESCRAIANAGSSAVVAAGGAAISRREWSRSTELMRTHWVCASCSRANANGVESCAACGAAAPQASST